MNKILNSIYHDTTKYFVSNPYPKRGEEIKITIRMLKNDYIKSIYIRYKKLGAEHYEKLELDYEKNGLSYYSINIECLDRVVSYAFHLLTDDGLFTYSQHQITDYIFDDSFNFKIITNYKAPKWMAKSVFYQILPDRFYNGKPEITPDENSYIYRGDRPRKMKWDETPLDWIDVKCMDFYGGDLYGIKEKLPYLKEIGVNAIYLNPIFTSPTMHKYDALDYFEIDPSLGGEEALIELSEEMHKNNMKLMLDISINHTSSSSKWFNIDGEFYDKSIGAYNNRNSKERNYYFINDDNSYETWAGVQTMPSLNYSNQEVRDIIYKKEDSVLKKWLSHPYNIDGWRFDVADVMARNRKVDVYDEVWEEINSELKSYKDIILLAEEWTHTPEMYLGDKWDSTMNYFGCARPIRQFAGEPDLFAGRVQEIAKLKNEMTGTQLKHRILNPLRSIPGQIQYQMLNLFDSHDATRLHNNEIVKKEVYKGAVITLFMLPGATSIYYGDEKYLDGRLGSMEGGRYPMDWSESLPKEKKEIFDIYQTMAKLKSESEVFEYGGFKLAYDDKTKIALVRFTQEEAFIAIWNKEVENEKISIDVEEFGLNNATVIIGNSTVNLSGGVLEVDLISEESVLIKLV